MEINNRTRKIIYFDTDQNKIYYDLLGRLNVEHIRNARLTGHENNISQFFTRPDKTCEVIRGIRLIPPRSRWFYDGKKFRCLNSIKAISKKEGQLKDLVNVAKKLLSVFENDKIAVELSGGLDTSIVIGILQHLGYDPFLIGTKSSRYELRTETFIQEIFTESYNNTYLIDDESCLPFAKLKDTPLHSYPSSSSLYYMHASLIGQKCEEFGKQILLSGMGFDALFCDGLNKIKRDYIPTDWNIWMLDDNWFNENIYNKHNITYKSGAASQLIIKCLRSLRMSQMEDTQKWWARNTFKKYLPMELVNYSYKADNSGGFLDGFLNSKNDISDIFNVTYDITKFDEFNNKALNDLYSNVHLIDERKDKLILSRVSFANWVYGLVRENLI